jgi:hypothetical protein
MGDAEPEAMSVTDRQQLRQISLRIIRVITELPPFKTTDMRKDWLKPPPLSAFRRLEPLGFGMPDEDEWWCFPPEDCPPDLVWPLNVGYVCERDGNQLLALTQVRSVTPREVRGYADRFSPFMARVDHAQPDSHTKTMLTAAGVVAWIGKHWVQASNRTMWEGDIPTKYDAKDNLDGTNNVSLATSIALRHRYAWGVALGLENSPSVRFDTDPTGIKEVFKVRDLPEGRDRREALVNWVGEHWRQNRHDPDVEIYVRKHMRGALSFSWKNMQGEIIPAPYDLEQRDRLVEERQAMHVAGTDRRPRSGGVRPR